jgi:hypothetical protein
MLDGGSFKDVEDRLWDVKGREIGRRGKENSCDVKGDVAMSNESNVLKFIKWRGGRAGRMLGVPVYNRYGRYAKVGGMYGRMEFRQGATCRKE